MKRDTGFLLAIIQSLKKFINNTYLRLDAANDPMQANLDMGNHELNNVDAISFNLTPAYTQGEGVFGWNEEAGTVQVGMPGGNVNLQVGQEILIRVKASENIGNGDVIYIDGAAGVNATVSLAQADNLFESNGTLAMSTEDISSGQIGYVTTFGLVRDLNTNSCTAGDIIYLDASTPGAWTNVKPTDPNYPVRVGYCVRKSLTEGIVLVNILQNTWETVVAQGYLAIDGSNANVPIDIGAQNFTTTGNITSNTFTINGTYPYTITQDVLGLAFANTVSGIASIFDVFTADGDRSDTAGLRLYGLGTRGAVGTSESFFFAWNKNRNQCEITSSATGAGVQRTIMVDATGGVTQFKFNTDGTIGFGKDEYMYFGAGFDAGLKYDGTNLLVDPAIVGSGIFRYVTHPTFITDEQIADKKYVDDSVASGVEAVTEIDHTDSPYTALATDKNIFADTSGGDVTVNLPAISGITGKTYMINNIASGAVTVDADGTETINGELTQEVSEDDAMLVIATSAEWRIV